MPENKTRKQVGHDEDGQEYYMVEEGDCDLSAKSRFWAGADGVKFCKAAPITEEERKEAAEIWDAMSMPGTSKGTEEKKPGKPRSDPNKKS